MSEFLPIRYTFMSEFQWEWHTFMSEFFADCYAFMSEFAPLSLFLAPASRDGRWFGIGENALSCRCNMRCAIIRRGNGRNRCTPRKLLRNSFGCQKSLRTGLASRLAPPGKAALVPGDRHRKRPPSASKTAIKRSWHRRRGRRPYPACGASPYAGYGCQSALGNRLDNGAVYAGRPALTPRPPITRARTRPRGR